MANRKRFTKADRPEAIARLLDKETFGIKPGMTLHTILRHRSSSGMSRVIDVVLIRAVNRTDRHFASHGTNGARILHLGYNAAAALGWTYDRDKDGLVVGGCGMDMGFHLVYSLSSVLFPKGFKIPKGQTARNGDHVAWDLDGGYALSQKWL